MYSFLLQFSLNLYSFYAVEEVSIYRILHKAVKHMNGRFSKQTQLWYKLKEGTFQVNFQRRSYSFPIHLPRVLSYSSPRPFSRSASSCARFLSVRFQWSLHLQVSRMHRSRRTRSWLAPRQLSRLLSSLKAHFLGGYGLLLRAVLRGPLHIVPSLDPSDHVSTQTDYFFNITPIYNGIKWNSVSSLPHLFVV